MFSDFLFDIKCLLIEEMIVDMKISNIVWYYCHSPCSFSMKLSTLLTSQLLVNTYTLSRCELLVVLCTALDGRCQVIQAAHWSLQQGKMFNGKNVQSLGVLE